MQTGIEALNDTHDLDGNGHIDVGAVDDFYSAVSSQFGANGTTFTNVCFRPTISFTVCEHAANAIYGNVTFDGLEAGQSVTLGSGQHGAQERFYNVNFTNVTGGDIRVNDYAIVNNLDLKGQECALTVGGRAQLNDLHAEGAHFLRLTAEPGAQIVRGHFNGTTIDMASDLDGSIWRNCEFEGATLRNVDFRGAQLADTHFNGCDMSGVDFTGARKSNCSITGDISKINAANAHFHNVSINGTVINSAAEFVALQKANAIGMGMADSFSAVRSTEPCGPQSYADLGASLTQTTVAQSDVVTAVSATPTDSPATPKPAPGQSISF